MPKTPVALPVPVLAPKVPSSAAVSLSDLHRLTTDAKDLRQRMELPLLPVDHGEPLPTLARAAARALDDACMTFLSRQPAIARATLSADVIASQVVVSDALAAVESATTPLGLALLQLLRSGDTELREVNQRVLTLLMLPPQTEILPGLTVEGARRLLTRTCAVAGVAAPPAPAAPPRSPMNRRPREAAPAPARKAARKKKEV